MNRAIPLLACAVLLSGCAVAGEPRPAGSDAPPPAAERVPADVPRPGPGTQPVAKPEPVVGEAPAELVAKMRADLLQRLAAAGIAEPPVVVSSEEVEWPDGGMGCGRPGEMHTMMIVPGYRVVFGVGPRRYAYHASRAGAFKYCAGVPLRVPPASGGRENPTT